MKGDNLKIRFRWADSLPSLFIVGAAIADLLYKPWYAGYNTSFMLVSLFYWLIYRPDQVYITALIFISLLHDVVNGFILGQSLVEYLFISSLVLLCRPWVYQKPFGVTWVVFALCALISLVIKSLFYFALYKKIPGLILSLYDGLVAVMFYPLLAKGFSLLQRNWDFK